MFEHGCAEIFKRGFQIVLHDLLSFCCAKAAVGKQMQKWIGFMFVLMEKNLRVWRGINIAFKTGDLAVHEQAAQREFGVAQGVAR